MDQTTVLWVLGVAVTVLGGVVAYILGRIGKLDDNVRALSKDVGDLGKHIAENYVRGHEIGEVKRLVETIRSEMTQAVDSLRAEVQHQVTELTKAVYQLIGKN